MIVIHHNPRCAKSRDALRLIEETGAAPVVIEYLKTGWTRGQLLGLFAAAGIGVRDGLRAREDEARQANLATADDEAILAAMVEHPKLVERPIVCAPGGVAICRPPERVLDLLGTGTRGPAFGEDGAPMTGPDGGRLA